MIFFYLLVLAAAVANHPWFGYSFLGLTVIKYLGAVCFCYAIFRLLVRRVLPPYLKSGIAAFSLVLFALSGVSYVVHGQEQQAWGLLTYISFALLFFVTLSVVDTRRRLRFTLLATVGAVAFAALYVLREFQITGGTTLRPGYVAGDSNYFAISCVLGIPVAVYFLRLHGPLWERLYCFGSLVVILPAFTLASSRGGLLALCVSMLYGVVRSKTSKRSLIILALVLLPMMLFAPSSPMKRLLSPSYADEWSIQIRQEFWRAGWHMFLQHPIGGVGTGNFAAVLDKYRSLGWHLRGMASNTYLEYAAELGLPGLLAYLGILFFAFRSLEHVRRQAAGKGDEFFLNAAIAIQTGLIGYAAGAFFISAEYQKLFWLLVFLVPCMLRLLTGDEILSDGRQLATPAKPDLQRAFDIAPANPEQILRVQGRLIGQSFPILPG